MANITFTEGSGLQDSIFGASQEPIKAFLEKRGEAFEANSILPLIFNMGTSTHWAEKFTTMTAMEGFKPVGENGAYPMDGMQEGFSKVLEHMTWKNKFAISREMVDDAKLMDLKAQPQAFITSYYRTREKFGAALLAAAALGQSALDFGGKKFDTTCADGKALFATDHPEKMKKKNQSNKFSNEFSAEALGKLETAMQNFEGDTGEVLDVAPDTIIIPNDAALKAKVFGELGADIDPTTEKTNAFNYQYGRWNIIVSPYLNGMISGSNKPYILLDSKYNEQYGSAMWLDRVKLEVNSYIDRDNDANIWGGYARFTAGFNDWRGFAIGGVAGGTAL